MRRGLALIEMALVLPLLLLLLLGLLEYGWIFLRAQQVTNAAREGARMGALADSTNADVMNMIASRMSQVGIGEGDYSVTVTPSAVDTVASGETVTVSVSARNVRLIGVPFLPAPSELHQSVSMAKEGT